jgi:hypothetical protein
MKKIGGVRKRARIKNNDQKRSKDMQNLKTVRSKNVRSTNHPTRRFKTFPDTSAPSSPVKLAKTGKGPAPSPAEERPELALVERILVGDATYENYRDTLDGILDQRIAVTVDLWNALCQAALDHVVNTPIYTPEQCENLATLLARWAHWLTRSGISSGDGTVDASDVLELYRDLYRGTSHYQRAAESFRQAAINPDKAGAAMSAKTS